MTGGRRPTTTILTILSADGTMKLFSVEEANRVLADIIPSLFELRDLDLRVERAREAARAAADLSKFGGGMPGGTAYVKDLYAVGRIVIELSELGIEIKDHSRGLIDFPSLRNDRIVLLCWEIGDGERISWWHEAEAGYAGRQPL